MTTGRSRAVVIMVQRDDLARTATYRLPLWLFRTAVGLSITLLLLFALVGVLYGPLVRAAVRVPGLESQVTRLQADNAKIRELSAALDTAETRFAQVRRMIGADIVRDPVRIASTLPVAPPIRAHVGQAPDTAGATTPRFWPLDEPGYLTRGQVKGGAGDEAHPGLDIAVPVGSLVRASAGATVRQLGDDPEYGLFVLLEHTGGYQSMYGHLSRILVRPNAPVPAGEVIGLSGSTGRSTAPHLHFEIRREGVSLDPLTLVKEGR